MSSGLHGGNIGLFSKFGEFGAQCLLLGNFSKSGVVVEFEHFFRRFVMACKRKYVLVNDDSDVQESSDRPARRSLSLPDSDVLGILNEVFQKLPVFLEPLLRKVVQDETERQLRAYMHIPNSPQIQRIQAPVNHRNLRLQFTNKLSLQIFTSTRIKAVDENDLQVVLLDSFGPVTSGSLSSLKVEFVALRGGFAKDDQDDWSEQEFSASIVREREGRRTLLSGDVTIALRNGFGTIKDLCFTDNSCWNPSRKFRLAARAVQSIHLFERIREAVTEPFAVKDHRGEAYMKHYPPKLEDNVWRLDNIMRDGTFHQKLKNNGIETVEDFLKVLSVDPETLKKIVGISGRNWESTIHHARTCDIDNTVSYCVPCGKEVVLMFNSVYELKGATFYGKFHSVYDLDEGLKVHVEKLKQNIYKNWKSVFQPESMIRSPPFLDPYVHNPNNPRPEQEMAIHGKGKLIQQSHDLPCNVETTGSISAALKFDPLKPMNGIANSSYLTLQPHSLRVSNAVASSSHTVSVRRHSFDPIQHLNALVEGSFGAGYVDGFDASYFASTSDLPEYMNFDADGIFTSRDWSMLNAPSSHEQMLDVVGNGLIVAKPSSDSLSRNRKAISVWLKLRAIFILIIAVKQSVKKWTRCWDDDF